MTELSFLGAARTVTGSKYLLSTATANVMVDCGLFQGLKALRLKNWQPLPFDPELLTAVVLTHAHIDHTGYLPRLVRQGFRGPVYASTGTAELCQILLPDSGRLQEVDARYANRKGFSKHDPALPLYTEADAREALALIKPLAYGLELSIRTDLRFRLVLAGHILGSSFVELTFDEGGRSRRLVFSGDLGRYDVPILEDPTPLPDTDYLVVESTYGNRLHEKDHVKEKLAQVVLRTVARGGRIVVPAFAVGRTQEVLFYLRELETEGKIPKLPVLLDSPMAEAATRTYLRGREDHDRQMRMLMHKHIDPLATHNMKLGRRLRERGGKAKRPTIVISASGMASGGRVLHHLKEMLPDERNTVVFVGYQAEGTRGRRLLEGERTVRMHGEDVPVRAEITSISGLSAHADYGETMRWLGGFTRPPRHVFVTHGEPEAALALRARIESELGWKASVPSLGDRVDLSAL